MIAQRRALILRPEQTAPLQHRYHLIDEHVQLIGEPRRHDVEPVASAALLPVLHVIDQPLRRVPTNVPCERDCRPPGWRTPRTVRPSRSARSIRLHDARREGAGRDGADVVARQRCIQCVVVQAELHLLAEHPHADRGQDQLIELGFLALRFVPRSIPRSAIVLAGSPAYPVNARISAFAPSPRCGRCVASSSAGIARRRSASATIAANSSPRRRPAGLEHHRPSLRRTRQVQRALHREELPLDESARSTNPSPGRPHRLPSHSPCRYRRTPSRAHSGAIFSMWVLLAEVIGGIIIRGGDDVPARAAVADDGRATRSVPRCSTSSVVGSG